MAKIWIHKTDTFEAAKRFDQDYYLFMGKTMRLDTFQFLRESYDKMKKGDKSESGKGLRRVVKVIQ